jgi:methionyl aminopeptidase
MIIGRKVIVKSSQEIEVMRAAGRINARALAAVQRAIRPGVTTAALDAIAERIILEEGGTPAFKDYPGPYPYPAVTTISLNDELVHGIPGERKLQQGDIVSVDCGTIYGGYVADSAITCAVGEVSPEARRLMDVTEEALHLGIQKMRAGNRVGDISAAIQNFVEGHGFHVTREYTGHGVGRQMHEGPNVPNYGLPGRGMVLRPGMTIALEPMVLVGTAQTRVLPDQWTVASQDGSLTAHYEHTVAVTEGDPLVLTQASENGSPGHNNEREI